VLLVAALSAAVVCAAASAATTATAAKRYADPVGDQQVEARCGDIRGITVSDSRAVLTLTVTIKGFTCGQVIVEFDTDRDRHWDYDLGFHRSTNSRADVDHFWPIGPDDTIRDDVSWKILSVWHHGDNYTLRVRPAAIGVKRAFNFKAHLNGHYMGDVVDTAPDYPRDWLTYRLVGG